MADTLWLIVALAAVLASIGWLVVRFTKLFAREPRMPITAAADDPDVVVNLRTGGRRTARAIATFVAIVIVGWFVVMVIGLFGMGHGF